MEKCILPKLAFDFLKEADKQYKETGSFSTEVLEILHSFFGETFVLATELLEKCRIVQYSEQNGLRKIFKIITSKEQYTIYEDINFCHCETFRLHIIESRQNLTCKHVLAVKLGQITGQLTKESVTGSHFVDFLNEQLAYIDHSDS